MRNVHRLLLSCAAIFLAPEAGATTVTVEPPDQDIWTTSVYSYAHDGGPGGGLADDSLRVGGWDDTYESLIEFNLAGLPATADSVLLRLYDYDSGVGVAQTELWLYQITNYWNWQTQGTGSDRLRLWWADQPATQLYDAAPLPAPSLNSYYYIDVTSLYNAWQAGSIPNYGLELQPLNTNDDFDYFYSSRASDTDLQPTLIIESPDNVPEPATLTILSLGVLLCYFFRKYRGNAVGQRRPKNSPATEHLP